MVARLSSSSRVYAVQNSLAAGVFAALLAAEGLAYLLYLHPSTSILWELTILLNRIAGPVLGNIDVGFGHGPLAAIAVLAAATLMPLIAWQRRHWLATAVSGHVALAISGFLTFAAVLRAQTGQLTASLDPLIDPASFDTNALALAAVTVLLIALCGLNHVMFFCRFGRT
jgi:hypothetical protein